MADPAALQEAIQRARQLAAKISHKRPANEMLSDSTREIGTVKVTHAYEKPIEPRPPRDSSRDSHRDQREPRLLDNNNQRGDNYRESARDGGVGGGGGQNRESRGEHRDNRDSRDNRSDRDRDSREPPSREHRESSNNRDNSMQRDSGGPPGVNIGGANAGSGGGGNYSRGSSDEKIDIIIPHAVIGLVIGKGGENIKRIQNETGATVRVDPNTVDEKGNKVCTITGTRKAVEDAHDQVANVIENASTNKRPRMAVEGTDQYRMKIPASRTGAIIGKGGETIKSIKQQSGCDIELDKGSKDCGPEESVFIIRGTQDRISKARALIEARLASRGRDGNDQGGPRSGGSSSFKSGVATGANAAPVAAYTDLPATYPAAAQQPSTDVSAAWAAYFAQYSNLYSQGGNQAAAATPGMPFAEQAIMGSTGNPQSDQMLQQQQQQQQQQAQQPPSQQAQQQSALAAQGGAQPDYSDQWIEYYLINGRPDFAQQIVEMKKQQQQSQKPTSS